MPLTHYSLFTHVSSSDQCKQCREKVMRSAKIIISTYLKQPLHHTTTKYFSHMTGANKLQQFYKWFRNIFEVLKKF